MCRKFSIIASDENVRNCVESGNCQNINDVRAVHFMYP